MRNAFLILMVFLIALPLCAEEKKKKVAVIDERMSGILKCSLTATDLGWNTKWRIKTATFVPADGEEIELKV